MFVGVGVGVGTSKHPPPGHKLSGARPTVKPTDSTGLPSIAQK